MHPQHVADGHDVVDETVLTGCVIDRHDAHPIVEHVPQCLDIDTSVVTVRDDLDRRSGTPRQLQQGQHVGGVLASRDEHAVTRLQRIAEGDGLQAAIPGDGG